MNTKLQIYFIVFYISKNLVDHQNLVNLSKIAIQTKQTSFFRRAICYFPTENKNKIEHY